MGPICFNKPPREWQTHPSTAKTRCIPPALNKRHQRFVLLLMGHAFAIVDDLNLDRADDHADE